MCDAPLVICLYVLGPRTRYTHACSSTHAHMDAVMNGGSFSTTASHPPLPPPPLNLRCKTLACACVCVCAAALIASAPARLRVGLDCGVLGCLRGVNVVSISGTRNNTMPSTAVVVVAAGRVVRQHICMMSLKCAHVRAECLAAFGVASHQNAPNRLFINKLTQRVRDLTLFEWARERRETRAFEPTWCGGMGGGGGRFMMGSCGVRGGGGTHYANTCVACACALIA